MDRDETLWWYRVVGSARTEAALRQLWQETLRLPEGNRRLNRLLLIGDRRRTLRLEYRGA